MRTERAVPATRGRRRPGSFSGRPRILAVLGVAIGLGLTVESAPASSSGDLFSWWQRELLPISFTPGGWVRVAREDVAEGQVIADTLTCRVLDSTAGNLRWIQVDMERSGQRWLVHLDPGKLGARYGPLDAVRALVKVLPGGELVHEEVGRLQESEFAQKMLEDVFEDPTVEIIDLPDSLRSDQVIRRRRAVLTETLTTSLPMGDRTMVHTTELRSVAILSAQVPILGLLSAITVTETSTRWEGNVRGDRTPRPPLVTETTTRCLDFGVESPRPLPTGLGR